MSATSTSSRSREEPRRPAARLARGRAKVSVPWIEALEDRTLLASPFATAASQLKTDFQSVQSGITNALQLASAIPILGNKLDLAAPLETLFGDFANPLEALLNPSPPPQAPLTATDIQNGLDAALGPWLGPKGIIAFNTPSSGGFSTTIDLRVAMTPETFNTADFNVGLGSFLTLALNSQASFQVGLDYLLAFSVDGSGNVTLDDSPSLQTTLSDAALPNTPLAIDFSLTLDHFKASGTIDNLMAVTAADVGDTGAQGTDPNPTTFAGAIGVAIGSNESASLALQATANVNSALALQFGHNAPINPKLGADLHLVWKFDSSTVPADAETDAEKSSFGTLQTLSLTNITLDAGDLLPGIITSIITDIQKVTKPLEPIVDFLGTEVPGLSSIGIHLSIESFLEADGQDGLVKVLGLIQFLNTPSRRPTAHCSFQSPVASRSTAPT